MKTTNIKRSNDHETTTAVTDMLAVSGTMQNRNSQTHTNTFIGDAHMERKNLFSKMGATLILVSLMVVAVSTNAFATGTTAGTVITSQASVDFKDANNNNRPQVISNLLTVTVAQKIVINFASTTQTGNTPDGTTITRYLQIVNNGNDADSYALTTPTVPSGWSVGLYNDNTNHGVWDGNEALIAGNIIVSTDASFYVAIRITIPHDAANNTNAIDGLTYKPVIQATSQVANHDNIVVSNLNHHQQYTYSVTIHKPVLTFSTSVTAPSPLVPGADFTVQLAFANTGSLAVTGSSTITFPVPNDFYYPGTGPTWSNEIGTFLYTASGTGYGGSITVTVPASYLVATTGSGSISFPIEIQQQTSNSTGPIPGSYPNVTNTPGAINLSYSDGTSPSKTRTETSQTGTGGSVTVVAATGVLATEYLPKTFNANPSDTKDYFFKIKNTGNVNNNYTFGIDSTGKTGSITTNFYFYQSSNLPADPTTATYAGSALSPLQITTITPGQEFWIKVSVQVQAGAADAAFNLFNLTSTSVTQTNVPQGGSYASTVSGYKITVTAPVLSIVISGGESDIISTPADQSGGVAYSGTKVIPGSVIRYTVSISNTGSGTANTVSSSNTGSDHLANMALVDNSVDLDDNNSRVDGTAGFEVTGKGTGDTYSNRVTLNVGTGILTVTFPSIASGETRKYRYNVAVQ